MNATLSPSYLACKAENDLRASIYGAPRDKWTMAE